MNCKATFVVLVLALLGICLSSSVANASNISYDSRAIIINGERRIIFSGAIHYPRSTPEMWPDLIRKAKEGGIDAIETYVFWDYHEPHYRQYEFSGNKDLIRFLKTIQEAGLYIILRIGPYVCAEWNYGGFPMWLHNMPGIELRTDNQIYKNEMQTFTTYIVNLCKEAKLFAPQGGPIILTQIENEYGNVNDHNQYGPAAKSYIEWAAKMALSQNVGVPWLMCQQSDAPQPMINTCNGFYCHEFTPNNPKSPKIWTENWVGWFKAWGAPDPHRSTEDVAYAVLRFIQTGGVLQSYYMYHGGTNFGRTSGGPFIVTSYDYDAPLDEYGNLNQPKYGHLKSLHAAVKSVEQIITGSSPIAKKLGNGLELTQYTAGNQKVCFLSNDNTTTDANTELEGSSGKFFVPAWSVSILADCNKEIFNSAKINTQISLMIKKPNDAEDEPYQLSWSWVHEPLYDTLQGKGSFTKNQLLEQKSTTVDASDYLWYMTSVEVGANDRVQTLRVNTTGHVLHAYVNKKLVGSQWENGKFVFEKQINLKQGVNQISLLSATVGLTNYGAHYDLVPVGIVGGPVQLIGSGNTTKDLSNNTWSYKIGLNGEHKKLYDGESRHANWISGDLAINKTMTWYKTIFKAPLGTDPVVVDLKGMGKGHAWVNGNSIGRFWPSYHAKADGCSETCDYRGKYYSDKCLKNCGNPSQRWYHVPRSFLNSGENTLVLFEELGGNPSQVSFQTVTVGKACGNAYEGSTVELSCQGGHSISAIAFASFGDPKGTCGTFQKGSCDASNAVSAIEKACVGKDSCTIDVSGATLGWAQCGNDIVAKRLAVEATCVQYNSFTTNLKPKKHQT
ncbi:hypothetical protein MKW92_040003 [Papaver armeniacum]|nr:hypothetical protein MKW92_040003 [Papaver armeniacum]